MTEKEGNSQNILLILALSDYFITYQNPNQHFIPKYFAISHNYIIYYLKSR